MHAATGMFPTESARRTSNPREKNACQETRTAHCAGRFRLQAAATGAAAKTAIQKTDGTAEFPILLPGNTGIMTRAEILNAHSAHHHPKIARQKLQLILILRRLTSTGLQAL